MRRTNAILFSLIIILVAIAAGAYVAMKKNTVFPSAANPSVIKDSGPDVSDFSAVFLTNGQVYFGSLMSDSTSDYLDLRNIYYLQQLNQDASGKQLQPAPANSANQPNLVLVKLGEELHGPTDRMQVNRQQVLFTESLKQGSKVVKAIADYKAKQ